MSETISQPLLIRTTEPLVFRDGRFSVDYCLAGDEATARAMAEDICLEQTVEFPAELVPAGPIRDGMLGRIESFQADEPNRCRARISFPADAAGDDLCQLLNVAFGNISLKPGIRVVKLSLTEKQLTRFRGPRFGVEGLRALTGVATRPLLSTALKPMGLSPVDLADLAYRFALGGIDLIKDDHGLTDQPFCRFEERVRLCADAVARANRETRGRSLYLPNITAAESVMLCRARLAKSLGAGGLLITPGLCGFDAMRAVADCDEVALPIMAHPAFLGSYVVSPDFGISHYALFGQIARLAGADSTIYPNFGGRFSFTKSECCDIAYGAAEPLGALRPMLPAPAGGLTVSRVAELGEVYGRQMVILVGGGLFKHGADLVENCRAFRALAEQIR